MRQMLFFEPSSVPGAFQETKRLVGAGRPSVRRTIISSVQVSVACVHPSSGRPATRNGQQVPTLASLVRDDTCGEASAG